MKKYLFSFILLILVVSFAWGALGDVVASFPAPAFYPIALATARNPMYMWVYCYTSPYYIYRINANTGSVYNSFYSMWGPNTRGLTYSYGGGDGLPTGSYLWIGSCANGLISRCNYNNGAVYDRYVSASGAVHGLAAKAISDGGYQPSTMMASNATPGTITGMGISDGSYEWSFEAGKLVYDLAWDWRNTLVWGSHFESGEPCNVAYGYTTNGSLVASFELPVDYPMGFTYTSNYLWVSTTTGSHRIWKIHCPTLTDGGDTNVEPASVGKVKAIYR
ncbi:MAG: hypothetical protein PVH29_14165 [Candidatus Zixiibacteriota bacterium]|jgi:hypothetical protein